MPFTKTYPTTPGGHNVVVVITENTGTSDPTTSPTTNTSTIEVKVDGLTRFTQSGYKSTDLQTQGDMLGAQYVEIADGIIFSPEIDANLQADGYVKS